MWGELMRAIVQRVCETHACERNVCVRNSRKFGLYIMHVKVSHMLGILSYFDLMHFGKKILFPIRLDVNWILNSCALKNKVSEIRVNSALRCFWHP